ncbi:MAG TPA: helix-turn-helix transcriptional regulator [Solirubrobacteraceae bacterium]|nr:helix-turn-helix transcriptional regulator [Solirubrobacteraceae bacterium]
METVAVGSLVRDWRTRRHLSQLDLALDTGISTRHLSFVETGRSNPSSELLLRLADQLELPLRDRNKLLLAAGYAPRFQQRELDAPELKPVRDAIGHVLAGHEPYPALAVDRHWNLVTSNGALGLLLEGVAPELLEPPANCMRMALHPRGLAPRIRNLAQWRGHLLARLHRELTLHGDPFVEELLTEVTAYPGPPVDLSAAAGEIMVRLELDSSLGPLSLFGTVATFGTAVDITVAELSVEAFFPADAATAEALRAAAARD